MFEPLEALEALESPPPPAYREQPDGRGDAAAARRRCWRTPICRPSSPTRAASPIPGSPAELEELRLRVRQLEAELEQRNAVAFEVQRHLQAALRRLYS